MDIIEAAKGVLVKCMGLSPGETTLVVTDTEKARIGEVLFDAALALGSDATMIVMKPRLVDGEEPPVAVAAAMASANVVLCPTVKSLTHTQARHAAARSGSRIATMPGITEDMFYAGALTADYEKVSDLTMKVSAMLDKAKTARIVSQGCSLTLSLEGRKAVSSTGRFLKPGESGNLPSGESYIAPVEGTAEGELYVDGSIAGIGKVSGPLLIKVHQGKAVSFEGADGPAIERTLQTPESRNVAELGIGTNDKARLTGVILEDEKIYGTVHVAFGDNSTFGGKVKAGIHIDFIILKPDLYLDGELIVSGGRILV